MGRGGGIGSGRPHNTARFRVYVHACESARVCAPMYGRRPHTGSVQFIFWAELRYLLLPAFVPSDCHSACRLRCKWDEPSLSSSKSRVCTGMHLETTRIDAASSPAPPAPPAYSSSSSSFCCSSLFPLVFFPCTEETSLSRPPSLLSSPPRAIARLTPRDARFNEPRRMIAAT